MAQGLGLHRHLFDNHIYSLVFLKFRYPSLLLIKNPIRPETSMAEWTSTVPFFFLFGKKCPTTSPYMGVRRSLVNNTVCSERIYECYLSAIKCRSESLSFPEG